jgi:hypothetical protein
MSDFAENIISFIHKVLEQDKYKLGSPEQIAQTTKLQQFLSAMYLAGT